MVRVLILDGMAWPSDLDPQMSNALDSFKDLNPGYTLKLYSGSDCADYIARHFGDEYLRAFHALRPYTYKCDFFRYLVLLREGGYYSDMRQVCLMPFDDAFPDDMGWFSAIDDLYMHTAFIAAVPGHPWIERAVRRVLENIRMRSHGDTALDPTGPGAFGVACDLREKRPEWLLGELLNGYIVSHAGDKVLLAKYSKPSGDLFGAGEWGAADGGGNNYNDFWNARTVYADEEEACNS
mmetsp:Transcript_29970/g.79791  ORF Transcript_29970/g.79791 Transcript_29970/m.79791 type:complete len:237 (-) Transcript_29970:33-743(-)